MFLLVWLRLVTRLGGTTPAIVPAPEAWEQRLAAIGHFLLYVFMIGTPLLGWLTVSAQGEPVAFMGWQLPLLLTKSEPIARQLKDVHETTANVGYALIGVHVVAALFHHYVRRDNTLALMWPGARTPEVRR